MKPLRIAIADDNWFVAQHLRGELATLGHIVVGLARTAQELVELVARERPDLALVDIRLADGSDGLAAAREIQKSFAVPTIAATGHLTAAAAKAADLLGLLSKPYTRRACEPSWKPLRTGLREARADRSWFADPAAQTNGRAESRTSSRLELNGELRRRRSPRA
jgi:two-component system, response regulator PdtaR